MVCRVLANTLAGRPNEVFTRTWMMRVLACGLIALGVAAFGWREFGRSSSNGDLANVERAEIHDGTIHHFVRKGDTLGALAKRYGVALKLLRELNHGQDQINTGHILTLRPGPDFWRASGGSKFTGMAPASDGVDFPVGDPEAMGYYNAQGFGENQHLGEDWNGNGGGDTDLGDPVNSVAHGVVFDAKSAGEGWGQVVRVLHNIGDSQNPHYVESLYGHLNTIDVGVGQVINRGQRLGTIGTANGRYVAHLHLEIRDILDLPIGPGYAAETSGYLSPTDFIRNHRPVR